MRRLARSFPRGRRLLLAAVLGAVVATVPAAWGAEATPTIEAVNEGPYYHHWHPSEATVAAGHAVTISNPTDVAHGVEWRSAIKPSCEEGAGKVPVGSTPAASGTKWSGLCTFAQPGSYTFYCTVHGPEMTAVITVTGTPTATTEAPREVTQTTATLEGTVKPEGLATSYYFEYGTTSSFGQQIPPTPQSAGSDFAAHQVSAGLTGLMPGTEYHVQLVASYGTSSKALGGEQVFTTPAVAAPTVTTGAASAVAQTEATLNGVVDPNGAATEYFFEYGTSTSYGQSSATFTGVPADDANHAVSAPLSGLSPGSEYHYRIVAKNEAGTSAGADRSFTTAASPPPAPETPPAPMTGLTTPLTALATSPPPIVPPLTTPPPPTAAALPALVPGTLKLSVPRHRSSVRGSVEVGPSGAGGRMVVELLAARRGHPRGALLGRLARAAVSAGRVSFSVALSARARIELHRRHRLPVIVRVTLTPVAGAAVVLKGSILLRA